MSKSQKNNTASPLVHRKKDYTLSKDKKSGLLVLSGPEFSKEDISREYPEDSEDRITVTTRASVGL